MLPTSSENLNACTRDTTSLNLTERNTSAYGQEVRETPTTAVLSITAKISIGSWLQNDTYILWNTLQRGRESLQKHIN